MHTVKTSTDTSDVAGVVRQIVVIGVGLIGGSFARALRASGSTARIIGIERSRTVLERAQALGLIDGFAVDDAEIQAAVTQADLIMLSAPVAQSETILRQIAPYLTRHAVVTDTGSTKVDVIAAARRALGERIDQFVPAHPIAGREQNGPEAACADLYLGRKVVLTPLPENTPAALACVRALWRQCGAELHTLSAEVHDMVFAAVSHLPHVLAYALVDEVANKPHADLLFQYAASGFRDFTRIAGSSAEMWRDIVLANRTAILAELDAYLLRVQTLRTELEQAHGEALYHTFARAQEARHNWIRTIEAAEKEVREGGD